MFYSTWRVDKQNEKKVSFHSNAIENIIQNVKMNIGSVENFAVCEMNSCLSQ